ncbi:hypothetical protein AAG570_001477 [Ranatra chinensis]|uniref:Kinesin motor domain-containing protein n=1 Tax=Ranatra chinensis TaxID=642074 RepID=A0ABD0YWZ6_9HEMI
MLATVSPCSSHLDETLATLRYASQASSIVNRVRVNEAPQDKIIRSVTIYPIYIPRGGSYNDHSTQILGGTATDPIITRPDRKPCDKLKLLFKLTKKTLQILDHIKYSVDHSINF